MENENGRDGSRQVSEGQQQRKPERPIHEVRIGHIKAAIWVTGNSGGVRHTVKVCRVYMGTDDEWKTADNFGRDDLLLLAKVVDLAHTWIVSNAKGPELPF